MTLDQLSDETKHMADLASVTVTLAAIADWLPAAAALASLVWTLIRIWETATVRRLLGRGGGE